ncbi:MAG: NPCBM/NEW2 domain-containing protein [Deltaproteobacteria bacterium]|nr:NPCBM/NEW2 domain-containing protein [Deltaproteobacteria bacterium]
MFNHSLVMLATCVAASFGAAHAQVRTPSVEEFTNAALPDHGVWLEDVDLSHMVASEGQTVARKAINGKQLTIKGIVYPHGVGTRGPTELNVALNGSATRFTTLVGIDDRGRHGGVLRFEIFVDGKRASESGPMKFGDPPKVLDVDLSKARNMRLAVLTDTTDVEKWDNANWIGAFFTLKPGTNKRPISYAEPHPPAPIIHSAKDERPAIHSARQVGATPKKPFLFLVAATGRGPLKFAAANLPAGLRLDEATGIISGAIQEAGTTTVTLTVTGQRGSTSSEVTIVAGPRKLAQTPPMGWNSWNAWGTAVDADKVRAAADAMVSSGLAAHGYAYINIDDAWEGKRDATGEIQTNEKFPDMKALADYVHSKGLKLGIYSSPGPLTCGKYEGSYKHEQQDARTFAKWGIDYLKYDWCSYGDIVKNDKSLEALQKPYKIMSAALESTDRDVVFSLCQYGMGKVWEWGKAVGGQVWRTTGDITDTWPSMMGIGFGQAGHEAHAGPGAWNDPDMLIVGKVGWGPALHPTRLAPHEQLTHITLWSLLAAPLLIGCDMTALDKFTLDLLTNDEVIAVDQDPLGKAASRVDQTQTADGTTQVWSRPLHDGTIAVGLFNTGSAPTKISATWAKLGITGKQPVRDLWRGKDLGVRSDVFTATVLKHSVVFVKIGAPKKSGAN